ncbi:MAG TPA: HNH endonuclease [bacterium]|nr:HNH endonuclease [bacterium]
MRRIQISGIRGKGKFTVVPNDVFGELNKYIWHLDSKGYAVRWSRGDRKNRKHIYVHRVVNNTPEGLETDHIDGDKLNNLRENLRSVTHSQNCRNRKFVNTSGYRGVSWHQGKWRATITINGKHKHLGYFDNKRLAYEKYCETLESVWLSTTLS